MGRHEHVLHFVLPSIVKRIKLTTSCYNLDLFTSKWGHGFPPANFQLDICLSVLELGSGTG